MINILYYLLISLGINLALFIPAFIFKTDKLTDLSYSLSFIILTVIALVINEISIFTLIVSSMVILWGLRLGIFLFIRIFRMSKDKRFDGIRESFFKFLNFWVLQGISVFIILLPVLFFINSNQKTVFWLGFVIWLVGLIIESIADFQKYKFNQNKKNKSMFIKSGIWKYSRHPNYFGEILCWIGVYLFVFVSLNFTQKIIGLISPVFIIFLLVFVTGLPILEKNADLKWKGNKEYLKYKRNTNILIPWFK